MLQLIPRTWCARRDIFFAQTGCRLDSLGNPQLASSFQMGSWSSKFNDLPLEANPPVLPKIPNCQAFITPEEQTQFKMKKKGPISFEKIDYKVKDAMGEVVLTIRPFDQYCFTKGRPHF